MELSQSTAADIAFEESTGGAGGGGGSLSSAQLARLLPALPDAGSRNNRIPRFNGDNLAWEMDGLIVEDPASPGSPSADNKSSILYRGRRLFINREQHAGDPQVTYRDFTATDLTTGFTWGGAVQVTPSPSSVAANHVIYSIPAQRFERRISLGGRAYWASYAVANWRGGWGSESDADQHVTAIGDVVYYGGGGVRVATAFTGRTPEGYSWEPLETHRFETVLSGSPVIIPAGTHTLHISFELARGRHDKTILLNTIGSTASRFYLDAANPTDNSNNNNVFDNRICSVCQTANIWSSSIWI